LISGKLAASAQPKRLNKIKTRKAFIFFDKLTLSFTDLNASLKIKI